MNYCTIRAKTLNRKSTRGPYNILFCYTLSTSPSYMCCKGCESRVLFLFSYVWHYTRDEIQYEAFSSENMFFTYTVACKSHGYQFIEHTLIETFLESRICIVQGRQKGTFRLEIRKVSRWSKMHLSKVLDIFAVCLYSRNDFF